MMVARLLRRYRSTGFRVGVRYYDYERWQLGAAPSDVEIHPVIAVQLVK